MRLAYQQLQGVQKIEELSYQAPRAALHLLEGHTSFRPCVLGATSQPTPENAKDTKAGLFLEKRNSSDGSRPPQGFPKSSSDGMAV